MNWTNLEANIISKHATHHNQIFLIIYFIYLFIFGL